MKNNLQDKAYKGIELYFRQRKTKYAYIKDKDGSMLIDEKKIADRRKEYVQSLYDDNDPELLIQMQENEDRHANMMTTTILRSEFEYAF